jgi:flagellar assembly protein FliH
MSSSPSSAAPATAWAPPDLRVNAPAATAEPDRAAVQDATLFEVGTTVGVPESLLTSARSAARAAGYAAGWAHGVRMAQQRATVAAEQARIEREQLLAEQRAGVARGVAALHAAAAALERQAIPGAQQLEALLLEAAYGIAEALVGHSLRDDETRAPAALARVLALAPSGEPVTVRLSPPDHAVVAGHVDPAGERAVTIVADPALEPGDAVAVSGATEVESRIRAGLQRIRDALGRPV